MLDEQDDTNLEERLREAAKQPPRGEEIREQMVSFVMGTKGERNTMTREQVKQLVDRQYGF